MSKILVATRIIYLYAPISERQGYCQDPPLSLNLYSRHDGMDEQAREKNPRGKKYRVDFKMRGGIGLYRPVPKESSGLGPSKLNGFK